MLKRSKNKKIIKNKKISNLIYKKKSLETKINTSKFVIFLIISHINFVWPCHAYKFNRGDT
jgi:hypothetical protein